MPDLLVEKSIYIVVQLAAVLQPLWPSQTTPSASWPRLVGRFLQILHSTGFKKKLPACCSGKAWILVQRVTSLDSAGTMHCIQTCIPTYMYPTNKDRTFILKVYERRWAVHSLRCNGKAIFQIHRGFNPKRAGGGGRNPPPSTFLVISQPVVILSLWNFMTFFLQALRSI